MSNGKLTVKQLWDHWYEFYRYNHGLPHTYDDARDFFYLGFAAALKCMRDAGKENFRDHKRFPEFWAEYRSLKGQVMTSYVANIGDILHE